MIDQSSQFYAILTNIGVAKQANADALGIAWKITHLGVGDANGTDPQPSATQETLINEWRRAPLNQLKQDAANPAIIIAEQVIPADVGGKWIREIGLYDADGDLVAVANCAPSFKPLLSQGSGRTQVVRMNLIVSNSANVELKIDPAVVLATRTYVDGKVLEEINKLDSKQSVLVATTSNIVLSGVQSVDSVALAEGDRVLVKGQTDARDNGIYVVSGGKWLRSADADSNADVTSALIVSVEKGVTLADSRWQLSTDGPINLGNTPLTFQPFINAAYVQAQLIEGLSQKLDLAGGQLTGKVKGKVGAPAVNNPNDCGFVFDVDTGMFSPADGTVQIVADGKVIFQNRPGGSAQFFAGVRAPKGAPTGLDVSSLSGYTFADDGDTGFFAEGGTENANSDLVFRIDNLEVGRLKSVMKAGAANGWTRLLSGKILQWAEIIVTPVANAATAWTLTFPTSFVSGCHQAVVTQGNGAGASKFQITVEGTAPGSMAGFVFSDDGGSRKIRVIAIGE